MNLPGPRPFPLSRREWVIYRRHHLALHTISAGGNLPGDFYLALGGIMAAVYRRRRAWTTSELQQVRDLRAQGKTPAEIGKRLDRTAFAVATCLSKLRAQAGADTTRGRRVPTVTDTAAIDAFLRKPAP